MKMQFDARQEHQLQAIQALVDVFAGQQQQALSIAPILGGEDIGALPGINSVADGIGNWLQIDADTLTANVREVQARNGIDPGPDGSPLATWEVADPLLSDVRSCPQFTIEMETGTGKTYVYLRSIMELAERYGYRKFVIVVPSVAIREGTLKSLEMLREHFATLYQTPLHHFVYDGRTAGRLREYAESDAVQVMIITVASFIRDVVDDDGSHGGNVIYKPMDGLGGRRPIDFVHAARPIVIIDEPQSVDGTAKAQEAISRLNPLFIARYSATHTTTYNLLYVLDPIKALEMRLVKQIWVSEVMGSDEGNDAVVRLTELDQKAMSAKVSIHVANSTEVKFTSVKVRNGDDLADKSKGLPAYREGFLVTEINTDPERGFVAFANGVRVAIGQQHGGVSEEIWRSQIEKTVEHHFEKVREISERNLRVKVLSLFFIDKVANYRIDPDDPADQGKFAVAFVDAFRRMSQDERYRNLPVSKLKPEEVHAGYFSQDKKRFKDTGGETKADEDTYSLIMRDKERLLSPDTAVQFIFSHSALREGWDNPNVFQICTLNETKSTVKKRQEIGRGLRVPVDHDGRRVFDDRLNRLVVVANESYEEFARKLQTEYEVDAGVVFGRISIGAIVNVLRKGEGGNPDLPVKEAKRVAVEVMGALRGAGLVDDDDRVAHGFKPDIAFDRLQLPEELEELKGAVIDLCVSAQITEHVKRESKRNPNPIRPEVVKSPEFEALWETIRPRTTYALSFDSEEFIVNVAPLIRDGVRDIVAPKISVKTARIMARAGGLEGMQVAAGSQEIDMSKRPLQDVLSYLQEGTELTRRTLRRILESSGTLGKVFVNPQAYLDRVIEIVNRELGKKLESGIRYERLVGSDMEVLWQMDIFPGELPLDVSDDARVVRVSKSVYEFIPCDSEVERRFALGLDQREDIKLFIKLPRDFKVDTPVGRYNPDWAIVKDDGNTVLLVRETKGTRNLDKLPFWQEKTKVLCGYKHFDLLGVSYEVATHPDDV